MVTHDTNSDFPLSGIIRIGLMFDQKMFAFLSKKFFLLSSSAVFEKFLNQLLLVLTVCSQELRPCFSANGTVNRLLPYCTISDYNKNNSVRMF